MFKKKAEKAFSVYRRFKKDFCPGNFVKKEFFEDGMISSSYRGPS